MSESKSRKKKPPKRAMALPDLEHAKTAVLNSLASGGVFLYADITIAPDSGFERSFPDGWVAFMRGAA